VKIAIQCLAEFNVTQWLSNNWVMLGGIIIAVFGLLVVGLGDLSRFSFKRIWAISGVCFAESIRKRVLLVAPLAIVGVILVSQLQRALDEQDVIHQTIKVCLFASTMVAVVSCVVLACTNLPKEIESKVIFTIVTKPTTRLELVIGKIVGFSRVSLAILAVMTVFTWGYVRLRAISRSNGISNRMAQGELGPTELARLTHFQTAGLLETRTLYPADKLQIYGRPPEIGKTTRVLTNDFGGDLIVPVDINRSLVYGPPPSDGSDITWRQEGIGHVGMTIRIRLHSKRTGPASDQPEAAPTFGPQPKPTTQAAVALKPPLIQVELLDENQNSFDGGLSLVSGTDVADLKKNVEYCMQTMTAPKTGNAASIRLSEPKTEADGKEGEFAYVWISPFKAWDLFKHTQLFVRVVAESQNVDFIADDNPVDEFIPSLNNNQIQLIPPGVTQVPAHMEGDKPTLPVYRGSPNLHGGQQLKGDPDPKASVAVFSFDSAPMFPSADGTFPFELTPLVDTAGAATSEGRENPTTVDIQVADLDKNIIHDFGSAFVESHEPTYLAIPASMISTTTTPGDSISHGHFQIYLHCENTEQTLSLTPASLKMNLGGENFEFNLFKSFLIIWAMSILVIILSILCSTFLSWPIAIVLTMLLLLGRVAVDEMSDESGPGLGNRIVNDFKLSDTSGDKLVSSSVDTLNNFMTTVAKVLPDSAQFDAISNIAQGTTIPRQQLYDALYVLGGFGIPALAAAYVIVKGKEVAP
jgi:ABC-type transport system involved in multi-copper enzyme maturation permease subunit